MDKLLKIALILTAVDQATAVTNGIFSKMEAGLKTMRDGFAALSIGEKGFEFLHGATDAFGEMETASNKLKMSIMKDGGILDNKVFDGMIKKSQDLSEEYANNSTAYLDMMRVLKNNGIKEQDILGEIGTANEKLAVVFDMQPAHVAEFVAHMKRDMGIANKDMLGMMDLVARMHGAGVGITGESAVNEMNQFFSKEGLSANIMQSLGLEQSKQVAAIAGLFIRTGLSGATVGTNFRRMLDTMRNPNAMKEVNDEAGKFGIKLDLFDKNQKFLGFANMVAEFDKLKNLDVQSIDKITHAFGGRQGLSNDFIAMLSKGGAAHFNEFMRDMASQADITTKALIVMEGQHKKEEKFAATWKNIKTNFGAAISEAYKPLIDLATKAAIAINRMVLQHPQLMKLAGVIVAVASAAMMFIGAIKVIQGVIFILKALRIAALFNPFTLIITAVVLGVALIITYWTEIKTFFSGLWESIKNIFSKFWNWLKNSMLVYFFPPLLIFKYWDKLKPFFTALWDFVKAVFMGALGILKRLFINFTPVGLIYKHWTPIVGFFSKLWEKAKEPFIAVWNWVKAWAGMFFDAGKKIIDSLTDGIMSKVHLLTDKIKGITKMIRDHFPFSPAKTGPLMDIHKIRLIETIADTIKPASMIAKMKSVMTAVRGMIGADNLLGFHPGQTPSLSSNTPTYVTQLHYAPTVHMGQSINPSGDRDLFLQLAKTHVKEMADMLQAEMDKRNRKKF